MLPYIPPTGAIPKKHIHLGVFKHSMADPSIHIDGFTDVHAPPYRFWPVLERLPILEGQAEFTLASGGFPIFHVVLDSNGYPITKSGIRFKLRVSEDELKILQGLLNRIVWFIDSLHCEDDAEHAYFLRIMGFTELNYEENLDRHTDYQIVSITLKDMDLLYSQANRLALFGL